MENLSLYRQFESLPSHLKEEVKAFIAKLLETEPNKKSKSPQRDFGILKGKIKISDDFDEPLVDFQEYM